ncbi:uncharacterized protein Dana_GF25045, isoform B [Drosophila ananassae]|uniref:Uncharacterized protein, isoform B n=1 Tax=Drosophila ananassae TaxID=7217 RepID=A0A0P8YFP5_DROAN|nr:uncharacterized protein LOC6507671 isoform X2 [Drosophila ananassae]KPU77747.1 uncharacterized protein Dana_GF25045, isoform B [Drosophila ananassae]
MNLILKLTTVVQLALLLRLAQIPGTTQGKEVTRDGVRLVMKTQSGNIMHLRAARGATEEEPAPVAGAPTETHRGRKNRKLNKSEDHLQPGGGHKTGNRKPQSGGDNGQHSQPKHKQGHNKNSEKQHRQGDAQQKQQHGHHRPGKKTGATGKNSENGCRYDKGTWSPCNNGQMTREDKLQTEVSGGQASDQNCDAVRKVNKKCKPAGNSAERKHNNGSNRNQKERKQKEKGSRRLSSNV